MSILLDRIHLAERRLSWVEALTPPGIGADVTRVESTLRDLGIARFEVAEEPAHGCLDHRWSIEGEEIVYTARFLGSDREPSRTVFYITAALATTGSAADRALVGLHLGLYEILVNVFDHGRPLPGVEPQLFLELRLGVDGVRGRIEDHCEEFDPVFSKNVDIDARVRLRARRGYGTTLIQRALHSLHHEHGDKGNVLHFRQRLNPCPAR